MGCGQWLEAKTASASSTYRAGRVTGQRRGRPAEAFGLEHDARARVTFTAHAGARGEPFVVPDRLWRLEPTEALATVTLPQHLHWSGKSRTFRLRDRRDRARVYEIVLRGAESTDLMTFIDGALLVDLWDDLVLPAGIRKAWEPVIASHGDTA